MIDEQWDRHGLSGIQWPIMIFGSPNCVGMRYDSGYWLCFLSAPSLRACQGLDERFLIDITGTRYDLTSPEFIDRPSIFWHIASELFGLCRGVRWDCSKGEEIAPDEFKKLLRRDWEEYDTIWQARDLEELGRRLEKATTCEEIIRVFGG